MRGSFHYNTTAADMTKASPPLRSQVSEEKEVIEEVGYKQQQQQEGEGDHDEERREEDEEEEERRREEEKENRQEHEQRQEYTYQVAIARGMSAYINSSALNTSFIVALGDNFYDDGVLTTNDTLWSTHWKQVYLQNKV